MARSKEEKRRRRAEAAGQYPKPRGRAPKGANEIPMEWDKQSGGWKEACVSTICTVEEPGTTVFAVSWKPPLVFEQPSADSSSGWSIDPLLPGALHSHEQCTPGGSRAHTFRHTSPGGTTRTDQYISPAAGRATGDERCAWRLRIVRSRREARGLVARYWTQCSKCHRKQHIMPDGRMFPHSLRETVPSKERALYKSEHRQSSDVWRCPGSHEYHGPECS